MLILTIKFRAIAQAYSINCTTQEKNGDKSTFLWSIESDDGRIKSYMFGTIHVPFTEVWEHVSERVKEAFQKANSIVFELDLHNVSTVETLMECKNMPNGFDVSQYLPTKLYARLKHYIRKYRQRLANWANRVGESKVEARKRARHIYNITISGGWEQRRPVWLLFLLYQLSERFAQNEHIPMLDLYLAQSAIDTNKRLLSIETPIEQCNPLSSVDRKQLVFAINYTLSYLEFEQEIFSKRNMQNDIIVNAKDGLPDLIHHYNCGSFPLRQNPSTTATTSIFNSNNINGNAIAADTIQQQPRRRFQKFTELWIREIPPRRPPPVTVTNPNVNVKSNPNMDISVSVIELSAAASSSAATASSTSASSSIILITTTLTYLTTTSSFFRLFFVCYQQFLTCTSAYSYLIITIILRSSPIT
ncbi:unnamed protein product [Anisakis simplex]|uniref:Metalloprotease TIKI homolog n=1 Tax=Anisakis simplex TaxID=6269 RepID=A0A0M3JQU6_ANISI|nr:unnamed protein product [Anisakis simplex]